MTAQNMYRLLLAAFAACSMSIPSTFGQQSDAPGHADFVEPDFPFITSTVVADSLSDFTPDYNWAVRGYVVQLGADTYLCFDPDLLRMAVAWKGDFISMMTMAQVSYHVLDKGNANPQVLGDPIAANGMYAGWMRRPSFEDPREPGADPADPGRGPLPDEMGAFEGVYVYGDDVVFSYRAAGTRIDEQPGLLEKEVLTRTFDVAPASAPLTLVAAEVRGARVAGATADEVILAHGGDTVTAVLTRGVSGLGVRDGRYVTLDLPPSERSRQFRVALWTGPRKDLEAVRRLNAAPLAMAEGYRDGGPSRWPETVATVVDASPDTSAFVFDHLELPDPNPWRRNVRPADLAFFEDGRAAVVTFDGDVWVAEGLSGRRPAWRRFASGMYETLAVEVVDGEIYAYGREGIVRLQDLNGDGEADYYEAFAPGIIQSTLSREWPFDLVARPGGGFFASQGGALHAGPTSGQASFMPGFLRGSPHNGSIVEVSSDGKDVQRYATGFRAPYLGIHPETGALTASDQQGNFVPSTPLYLIERGGYYGVPATAHLPDPLPRAIPPLTWIPHRVDPSATSQVWMPKEGNGPLDGQLVHLSYGSSGLFRVYVDSLSSPAQGAVAPLPDDGRSPTLKGAVNPADGRLYVTGFQVWGSTAQKLTSLRRLRYTGRPTGIPEVVRAGKQGILLTFAEAVDAPDPEDVHVTRYNYLRSSEYGSGHYRLDGSEGEERLPVAGLHVSPDGRALLIVLPDMRDVMQMAVDYDLSYRDGPAFSGDAYLTVNAIRPLRLDRYGLGDVEWQAALRGPVTAADVPQGEELEATAVRGRHLYHEVGCVACHSTDGSTAGKLGPSFDGLYGSMRTLESGESVEADDDYLRTAILDPGVDAVAGFDQEMPSFRGILGESDVESMILFIRSLNDEIDE